MGNSNFSNIKLQGVVTSELKFVNEFNTGEKFYTFDFDVERKSGTIDKINCRVSSSMKNFNLVKEGAILSIEGSIRTRFERIDQDDKILRLSVFCLSVEEIDSYKTTENNVCELHGTIYRDVNLREIASSHRSICDLKIKVDRSRGKYSVIPVIAWGRYAEFASQLKCGDEISVTGRLQSREIVRTKNDVRIDDIKLEVSADSLNLVKSAE